MLADERHPRLARLTRVARFVQVEAVTDIYPPLVDAQVVLVTDERLVIAGLEATGLMDDVEVAQGWALLFAPS